MTRAGYRLTADAEVERADFDMEYGGGNCSCHISPPCGSCIHPGNPRNQDEDETAWEEDTMITREQYELVRPLLEAQRKKTRPRTHDLFDVLNLILLRDAENLTWRRLPPGSLPWRTVHEYHAMWSTPPQGGGPTVLDQVREKLGEVQP